MRYPTRKSPENRNTALGTGQINILLHYFKFMENAERIVVLFPPLRIQRLNVVNGVHMLPKFLLNPLEYILQLRKILVAVFFLQRAYIQIVPVWEINACIVIGLINFHSRLFCHVIIPK